MTKFLLALDDKLAKELEAISIEQHLSKTQIMRQALRRFIDQTALTHKKEHPLAKFAGVLQSSGLDGLELQHKLRAEWD